MKNMTASGLKNQKQKTAWKTGRMGSGFTIYAFTAWCSISVLF
jgi:hypothetical protein